MANIPLGNFDLARAVPRTQPSRVDLSGSMEAGRAIERAGQTMMGVAEQGLAAQRQKQAAADQQAEALARARAANAVAEHRLKITAAVADVEDQLRRGVDYNQAGALYDAAIGKIEPPQIDGLPPAAMEAFKGGIEQGRMAGRLQLDGMVVSARRDAGQTELGRLLDTLGKASTMPGADVAAINGQARAALPLFREFGLDGSTLEKAVQDFEDRNWVNQAQQRFNSGHDDPASLQQLLADLTGEEGAYAGRLDPDKRNVLALRVGSRIDTLEAKAQAKQDRTAAAAERALGQMDEQFATGVPATMEQWTAWAGVFEAAPQFREQFQARIADEKEIQAFLRQPIDAQLRGVQERQAALLREGGDKRAIANVNRIKQAVEANVKLLREQPLQFAQSRQAETVEPLPLADLADPGQAGAVSAALQQRATIVEGLRRQYGPQVQQRLLLPQEADALVSILDGTPAKRRPEMFAQLRKVTGSDATYTAVMQQVSPDAPVTAMAGLLHLRNPKAAALVAQGEAILNRSKGDAAEDGNFKATAMPKQADFDLAMSEAVGSAFRGRPEAYSVAMQAVRAGYAGAAATDGDVSGEFNEDRLENIVKAVLGETVDVNGRGQVFVPYGMDPDEFEDRLDAVWQEALPQLPPGVPRDLDGYGLQQAGDGRYYVTAGRMFLQDRKGRPFILEVRR